MGPYKFRTADAPALIRRKDTCNHRAMDECTVMRSGDRRMAYQGTLHCSAKLLGMMHRR